MDVAAPQLLQQIKPHELAAVVVASAQPARAPPSTYSDCYPPVAAEPASVEQPPRPVAAIEAAESEQRQVCCG